MKSYILVALACLSLVACSRDVPTIATSVQQTGGCTIPPRTYDDLNLCTGEADQQADHLGRHVLAVSSVPS
jgi:hypothetical protein